MVAVLGKVLRILRRCTGRRPPATDDFACLFACNWAAERMCLWLFTVIHRCRKPTGSQSDTNNRYRLCLSGKPDGTGAIQEKNLSLFPRMRFYACVFCWAACCNRGFRSPTNLPADPRRPSRH